MINLIEYISLILVTSYFIFHNIFLVIIGISISLYKIYKDYILKTLKLNTNKKQDLKKTKSANIVKENSKELDKIQTLAEIIEELGYIPSINKH
tara:strand:- start:403 stop:684 length:282 start_codon:yes stop_codon:yes gene_type:complete